MENIRESMRRLWEETFGDPPEYVDLVFDAYFNPDLIAFREEGGRLQSMLLGVPYEFEAPSGATLRGLYLCGLATRPGARRRGMMGALLEEINARALSMGFDFTFLIPDRESIRDYYRARGYHDSFYKVTEHFVHGHRFGAADGVEVEKVAFGKEADDSVIDFLIERERRDCSGYSLRHSRADWTVVLREAGEVYVARRGGAPVAVAFPGRVTVREREIKKIYAVDFSAARALLQGVEAENPAANLTVVRDAAEMLRHPDGVQQVWSPFFGRNNGPGAEYEDVADAVEPFDPMLNAVPYGMVRATDVAALLEKLGAGACEALHGYSNAEKIALLLRRPQTDDSLGASLALPALTLSMSLMLD